MKLKILIGTFVTWLLTMSIHFCLYLASIDTKTEYGNDDLKILGTMGFIFYIAPYYILGLVIVIIILISLLPFFEKKETDKSSN